MRVGIDAHMIGDHSGGNESFYTNIINNMNPPKNMEIILFVEVLSLISYACFYC